MTQQHNYRGSGTEGVPVQRRTGAVARIPAQRRPEGLRLRLLAHVWNSCWELLRRVPEPIAFGIAHALARAFYLVKPGLRARVRRTFARVVPPEELERTVRQAYDSYGRYWVEAFRAADIDPADLDARTTTEGFEYLDKALDDGRGAIILLAHHGSWDMSARWAETHGYHLAVVAEVVRPRRLFEKFVRLREEIGLEVVPLRRGGNLAGRLSEVLAENHMVGLLSDRDLTRRAPVVPFFGEDARIPSGPVVLSRRTGAPILPVTMLQRPNRTWHIVCLPAIDVTSGTVEDGCAELARALEQLVSAAPEQWHAFSPVWIADEPARRRPGRGDVGTS